MHKNQNNPISDTEAVKDFLNTETQPLSAPDEDIAEASARLMEKNLEAYKELAK